MPAGLFLAVPAAGLLLAVPAAVLFLAVPAARLLLAVPAAANPTHGRYGVPSGRVAPGSARRRIAPGGGIRLPAYVFPICLWQA